METKDSDELRLHMEEQKDMLQRTALRVKGLPITRNPEDLQGTLTDLFQQVLVEGDEDLIPR